ATAVSIVDPDIWAHGPDHFRSDASGFEFVLAVGQSSAVQSHVATRPLDDGLGLFASLLGDQILDAPIGDDGVDEPASHRLGHGAHGPKGNAAPGLHPFSMRYPGAGDAQTPRELRA